MKQRTHYLTEDQPRVLENKSIGVLTSFKN